MRNPAVEWGQSQDKAEFVRNIYVTEQCSAHDTHAMCPLSTFQINDLKDSGFESIHTYDDDGQSEFMDPWAFLTCLKHSKSRSRWYRSVPELEIELHQRLYGTKSGKPTLRYVDAPTMIGYQIPTKAQETTFCRSGDIEECDYYGFDPEDNVIPISHFETRKSTVSGKYGGRGLFAAQDIPKYSLMSMNMSVHSFHMLPSTWSVIEKLDQWADDKMTFVEDEMSTLVTFTEGYGYKATLLVSRIILFHLVILSCQ